MPEIPLILLAAGSSRRMGQTKQLLPWGNSTLIGDRVKTLLELGSPVIIVLGAYADAIRSGIEEFPVEIVVNPDWGKGIGTSVARSVRHLKENYPDAGAVLMALVDQPLVSAGHFQNLLAAFDAGKNQIVVSHSDDGWEGVPAVFDRFYFSEMEKLDGENGAKSIIRKYADKVISVDAGDILADMDSPETYRDLLRRAGGK